MIKIWCAQVRIQDLGKGLFRMSVGVPHWGPGTVGPAGRIAGDKIHKL